MTPQGSGMCGLSQGLLLLCLLQVPLGEEFGGHLSVQMVPVPADVILPGEVSLGQRKEGLSPPSQPTSPAPSPPHCHSQPPPPPHGPQEGRAHAGEPAATGMTQPREGAPVATHLSDFMLWCKDFGEELQVNLSIL